GGQAAPRHRRPVAGRRRRGRADRGRRRDLRGQRSDAARSRMTTRGIEGNEMAATDAPEVDAAEAPSPVAAFAQSPVSEPFWQGLAEGRLTLPYCDDCGAPHFYPRRWCPQCWSDQITWREVEGVGTVWALSTVHLPFQNVPASEIPYTVVFVDIDAGVRLPGRVSDAGGPVAIGDRVRLEFAADPSRELPKFRA